MIIHITIITVIGTITIGAELNIEAAELPVQTADVQALAAEQEIQAAAHPLQDRQEHPEYPEIEQTPEQEKPAAAFKELQAVREKAFAEQLLKEHPFRIEEHQAEAARHTELLRKGLNRLR
jgi:hypothetical protein